MNDFNNAVSVIIYYPFHVMNRCIDMHNSHVV